MSDSMRIRSNGTGGDPVYGLGIALIGCTVDTTTRRRKLKVKYLERGPIVKYGTMGQTRILVRTTTPNVITSVCMLNNCVSGDASRFEASSRSKYYNYRICSTATQQPPT